MRFRFFPYLLSLSFVIVAAPAAAALFGDNEARKGVAEQKARVDGLTQRYDEIAARLAKLEDAVKAQSNNLDAAAKRQRDMYVDLDTRLRRFEQTPPPGAPVPGPGAAAPPPAAS